MEKYCLNCGVEYQNKDIYCGSCGNHRKGVEKMEKQFNSQQVMKPILMAIIGLGVMGALFFMLFFMDPFGIRSNRETTKTEAIEDKWYGINGRITFDNGEVILVRDGERLIGEYDFDEEDNGGTIDIEGESYDFVLDEAVLVIDELGSYFEDDEDERLLEAIEKVEYERTNEIVDIDNDGNDQSNNNESSTESTESQEVEENIESIPSLVDLMGMKESDIVAILGEPSFSGNYDYLKYLFYDSYSLSVMIDTTVSDGDVIALQSSGKIQVMDSVVLQETYMDSISVYRKIDKLREYMIVDQGEYTVKLIGSSIVYGVEIYKNNSAIENMHSGAYYMSWTYDQLVDHFGKYYYSYELDGYDHMGYHGLPYEFCFKQGGDEALGNRVPYYIKTSVDGYVFDSFTMVGMTEDELTLLAKEKEMYVSIFDDHIDLFDAQLYFKCYREDGRDLIRYVEIYYQRDKYEPVSSWEDLMIMDYMGFFDDQMKKELQRKYDYLKEKFGVEIYMAMTDQLYGMTEDEYLEALYNNHKTTEASGGYSLLYLPNRDPQEVYFATFGDAQSYGDFSTQLEEKFIELLDQYVDYEATELIATWILLAEIEFYLTEAE